MSNLKQQITQKKKTIAVYGLGNVGAPIAAVWLKNGAKVIGVDISKPLLDDIKKGQSHKKEPFISEIFSKFYKKGNFILTSDGIKASKESDIKIVIVPVALTKNKPDFSSLISVTETISFGLKKGDSVIISPSVPPGTTKNLVLPILEKNSGLKGERDFKLIYNPERIFEGRAIQDIESNYPAIVAGLGKNSLALGKNLLEIISKKGVIILPSLETAEVEKLFEGVYRDVNIALANELSEFCEKIKVDFWQARIAANSQPFCHLHYPGTGVGGLCIPVYPKIVLDSSKKIKKSLPIIEKSRYINDQMPKKCVKDALRLLGKTKKNQSIKIAVLGLGFRGDVTDSRLSPTYDVVKEFQKKGYKISVHDPYIIKDDLLPRDVLLSKKLSDVIKNADLIFVSTDHKIYSNLKKHDFVKANTPLLIFDGRNILKPSNFSNITIKTLGKF